MRSVKYRLSFLYTVFQPCLVDYGNQDHLRYRTCLQIWTSFWAIFKNPKAINIYRIKSYLLKIWVVILQIQEMSKLKDSSVFWSFWTSGLACTKTTFNTKAWNLQAGKSPISIKSVSYYYTSAMQWGLKRSKNISLCRGFFQKEEKELQQSQNPKQRKKISTLISARNDYSSSCLIRLRQIWKIRT